MCQCATRARRLLTFLGYTAHTSDMTWRKGGHVIRDAALDHSHLTESAAAVWHTLTEPVRDAARRASAQWEG
jgi:hypothetical protein